MKGNTHTHTHTHTHERRIARIQHQIEVLEAAERMEGLLNGPGIDDSVVVKR